MANLPPYKHLFAPEILERAEDYLGEDDIEWHQIGPNDLSACVWGSRRYRVHIAWDERSYTTLSCNCPYDWDHCKHLAAVLITLHEEDVEPLHRVAEKDQFPVSTEDLEPALKKLKKAQLIELLMDVAHQDQELAEHIGTSCQLMLHDAPPDFGYVVKSYLNRHRDRYDLLDWRSLSTTGSYFVDMLYKLYRSEQFERLIDLSTEIIVQINRELVTCDDPDGNLSYLVDYAFECLDKVTRSPEYTDALHSKLFQNLILSLEDPDIYHWDCGINIWYLLSEIIEDEDELDTLEQRMDAAVLDADPGFSTNYFGEKAIAVKSAVLSRIGKHTELNAVLWENKQLPDVREKLVRQLIPEEDWDTVDTLLLEGIRQAHAGNFPGVVHRWEKLQFEVAKLRNDRTNMLKLARHILVNHRFSMENFLAYKALIPESEWPRRRARIVEELKKSNRFLCTDRAQIFAHEKMLDSLFDEIEQYGSDFYLIDEYSAEMASHDPDRLRDLYISRIQAFLARHTGRKYYKVAVRYIRRISKLGYPDAARALAEELRTIYSNRPALLQEFEGL